MTCAQTTATPAPNSVDTIIYTLFTPNDLYFCICLPHSYRYSVSRGQPGKLCIVRIVGLRYLQDTYKM